MDWIYEKVMKKVKPDITEQSVSKELIKGIGLNLIIETVCEIFKVEREELLKRRSVTRQARMVYIDLCCRYRLFHKSLKEIGQELGGLTVGGMSQVRKRLREALKQDDSLRIKFNQCAEVLNNE